MTKNRAAYRNRARPARRSNARTGGFVDVENKFLDSELTLTATTTTWQALNPAGTGCTNSLSVPAQGDGESERDGRVYYIKSLHLRGSVQMTASESDNGPQGPAYTRVVVYWDTQTNAAEATATDIMDAGGTSDSLAFRNLQNSKRFVVLYDKTVKVTPTEMNEGAANLFAQSPAVTFWKFNKNFKKPIKVRCSGTTANVSSVTDNNIGIAFCSFSSDGASLPSIQYQSRIRFQG